MYVCMRWRTRGLASDRVLRVTFGRLRGWAALRPPVTPVTPAMDAAHCCAGRADVNFVLGNKRRCAVSQQRPWGCRMGKAGVEVEDAHRWRFAGTVSSCRWRWPHYRQACSLPSNPVTRCIARYRSLSGWQKYGVKSTHVSSWDPEGCCPPVPGCTIEMGLCPPLLILHHRLRCPGRACVFRIRP